MCPSHPQDNAVREGRRINFGEFPIQFIGSSSYHPHTNQTHRLSTPHYPLTMRSFALVALVFSAFVNAAPVAVQKRELASIPDILTGLLTELTPVTDALNAITASDLTADTVGTLVDELTGIVTPAVSQIAALTGQPLEVILGTAEGVVDATGVAKLLEPVLTTTYGALNSVFAIAQSTGLTEDIQPLLNTATAALNPILATAAPLVNGLLAAASPILAPTFSLADKLGLSPVLGLVAGIL
ncbi:hypothetical protein MKEN_01062100 [Mycena kentingensis (nom. inval.)]|nr:hypothetical protein MKEN_01062100 [Mycena kentingensis (nom. inval.)]